VQGDGSVFVLGLSPDARFTVLVGSATNLVAADTNNGPDAFLHDRLTGGTSRESVGTGGTQGNGYTYHAVGTSDGRYVVFESDAQNLVSGDTNGVDIFLRDRGQLAATPFCFGDGTQASACPCGNSGAPGHGCENSAATGGGLLSISGFSEPDSAVLAASGLPPTALAIFLEGNAQLAPGVSFGDGVRCAGGTLKRLYIKSAVAGIASAPEAGDSPLGFRSAFLGDPIAPGTSRWYQTYYRDPDPNFCAAPAGNLWNVTNGVQADW
jgi:hypothetical protein